MFQIELFEFRHGIACGVYGVLNNPILRTTSPKYLLDKTVNVSRQIYRRRPKNRSSIKITCPLSHTNLELNSK